MPSPGSSSRGTGSSDVLHRVASLLHELTPHYTHSMKCAWAIRVQTPPMTLSAENWVKKWENACVVLFRVSQRVTDCLNLSTSSYEMDRNAQSMLSRYLAAHTVNNGTPKQMESELNNFTRKQLPDNAALNSSFLYSFDISAIQKHW